MELTHGDRGNEVTKPGFNLFQAGPDLFDVGLHR